MSDPDQEVGQDPLLKVADVRFLVKCETDNEKKMKLKEELLDMMNENSMYTLYETIWEENGWSLDLVFLEKLKCNFEVKKAQLNEKLENAEQNEGDVEVRDIQLEMARCVSLSCSKEEGIESYLQIKKGLTMGKNIDRYLSILRICLAYDDDVLFKKYEEMCGKCIEKGGDWDRRNRFSVYVSAHLFRTRDFEGANNKLLDAISTFTATELFDYKRLVCLTVVSSVMVLNRVMLKKKVVDCPEILTVIDDSFCNEFALSSYLNSIYQCKYDLFFQSLIDTMKFVRKERYMSIHGNYYLREVRLRAYDQFLQSYLSVTLESMASAFGVSSHFLDMELSSFIASDRLQCKIDKVNGVVTMNRVDDKNRFYQEIIKRGDNVLAKIQKLSRVIAV